MSLPITDPNYPGFPLPAVINPPDSLCFLVKVPNDQAHIAAFLGVLFDLTQWINWQRDPAKRGKDAAAVWRAIWTDLAAQSCAAPVGLTGSEMEDFMPLRVDCDCNVFVTCCDGTEVQIYTAAQVKALLQGSNVAGAPQTTPGTCQDYALQIINGGHLIAPTPVSTGDTIQLQLIAGATTHGTGNYWRCADGGGVFFAGACSSSVAFDAGALVPATPLGEIVVKLNSTWYAFTAGSLTVPAGVSLVQPEFALNYVPTDAVAGTISFTAHICNHQTVTTRWTHVFDFKTDPGPFIPAFRAAYPTVPLANWSTGNGWQSVFNADGSTLNEMRMYITGLPSTSYDTMSDIWTDAVNLDENAGGPGSGSAFTVNFNATPLTAGTNVHSAATATPYTATSYRTDLVDLSSHVSHVITLSSLTLSGIGVDPF